MKNIVLSIGGSVILSDDIDASFLQKLAVLLHKINKEYKLYIVVGGGNIARRYIRLGRHLGYNEQLLDTLGIEITRVNARFLTHLLDNTNKKIPLTTDEATQTKSSIVVMGGTTPGHSTDMVGAELAEKVSTDLFIIATNVDGIYDKDPNKFSDAKQIKEISIDKLIKQFGTSWECAGKNVVIDGPALTIIKRARIQTYVFNGKKLDQLEKVVDRKSFIGTRILV